MRKWNFSPGPAAIPDEVLLEVQSELLEFKDDVKFLNDTADAIKKYT